MSGIRVVAHQKDWEKEYQREAIQLNRIFQADIQNIYHIGSTAVPALPAKPTIDILIEVRTINSVDGLIPEMKEAGYQSLGENGIKGRRYFQRLSDQGDHLSHIHVYGEGNPEIIRHLAFRDYLRTHGGDAEFYGSLKQQLAEAYPNDRESYCKGKEAAIRRIEDAALEWWYNQ